ncbi:hypothetical protein BDM02DRAFT_2452075 [Thelephora ganbajun]|uniref:Uncharacterized protein n=1 Tax=Thelephora ganbajun TaxID=370292 RepID=A0ACB6ZF02_THEGA|nr:hypothetical protein BDM02DRAFT_2452075 [Thelephora ganbajun]
MSDNRPPFPARGRPRSRSSSHRFPPLSSRQPQPLSASSSNSLIYPRTSPTVENHPQYLHYVPPQPHYPPHTSYANPYASQPMITTPAYAYSLHSPTDMQGAMGPPVYMHSHSQQQDPPSSNLSSPRPSPFSQHGHIPPTLGHQPSPPPPVTSGPPHFSSTPGYHAMSYSSQPPTHFGYPSPQSYPNPGYQPAYPQPSFHSPYQPDQDNQWWYSRQYEGPQFLHQQPYHMPYQTQQQQSPAERYRQQQLQSGPSSDIQLRSPHISQPQARFTPTQPSQPTVPTSPPPKSDPQVQSPPLPQSSGKEPVRQPYHPNPPPQRSEWVMWAGNVPSDTTNEELWKFFNKPPDSSDEATEENAGVSSVFLIARSNCAFVNFDTEAHLSAAIARFSGQKIRPGDPKCPNLVCRVRKKTDDLRAGVGGQRGVGLHMKWIQERKQKAGMGGKSPVDDVTQGASNLSLASDEESGGAGDGNRSFEQSSGSGSFTSSTSSILQQHFPKRYFILKSLTQYDLDLSVEKGYWATQRHNEVVLDQAYRNSTDVYLVFGVNKSGEFYGYASPVLGRSPYNQPPFPVSEGATPLSSGSHGGAIDIDRMDIPGVSNDGDDLRTPNRETVSAPAELHQLHRKIAVDTPETKFSADVVPGSHEHRNQQLSNMRTHSTPVQKGVSPFQPALPTQQAIREQKRQESHEFRLDRTAPFRALRHPPASASAGAGGQFGTSSMSTIEEQRRQSRTPESLLDAMKKDERPEVDEEGEPERVPFPGQVEGAADGRAEESQTWGEPFRLQWIKTERLPFYRTRHLRNPKNQRSWPLLLSPVRPC